MRKSEKNDYFQQLTKGKNMSMTAPAVKDTQAGIGAIPILDITQQGPECRLNEAQLKRLQPYIVKFMEETKYYRDSSLSSVKDKLKVVAINDTQAAFELECENALELLESIRGICRTKIAEQLIVRQPITENLEIKHRVMEFEVARNQMFVKFFTLGKSNDFDFAMTIIAKLYWLSV